MSRPRASLRWLGSLRLRLLVTALLWMAIIIALGGVALALSFRTVVAQDFDDRLQDMLLILIGSAEILPNGRLTLVRPLADARFDQVYSGWYWVMESGDDTLRSRSLWDQSLPMTSRDTSATPRAHTFVDASGANIRVVEQTVALPSSPHPITFALTGNLEQLDAEARSFNRLLWISLCALGIGLLIAVATQVSIGLRPLRVVAREVERIRSGQQSHLTTTGLSEIDLLVIQVNTLIDHDREQLERYRGNAADLAHSLKTPLAILRSSLQAAEHDEQRAQLDNVQRLIDRQLARAASAGPRVGAVTEVEPVLRAIVTGIRRMHAERHLDVQYDCADDLRFPGDAEDLEEMLGNLLDNACKWARSRVSATASSVGDELVFTIEDDGPGMSESQGHRAIERGRRFDERAPGSGLGLTIVSDLLQMYAGRMTLTRGNLGGTRVELRVAARAAIRGESAL